MTSQVLIASYAKDFEWLIHCLTSLKRFSSGFLPPVVCVASEDFDGCRRVADQSFPEALVTIRDGRPGQGFMRAQIAMMHGDELCPDADFIFLLGSDCLAIGPFTPEPYFTPAGKPAMLYSSYAIMQVAHKDVLPWRPGVTRILGWQPDNEYMRRLPLVYPRALFGALRAYVGNLHGVWFDDYIYREDAIHHNTSESNLLGAFAHRFMPEIYEWVNIADAGMYGSQVNGWPTAVAQMWSHGGLDRPMEANFIFNGKQSVGLTPRQVIDEVLYNIPTP